MKARIEFDLPEESEEHRIYINAQKWYSCLWDMEQRLRSYLKYGHKFNTTNEAIESIRNDLWEDLKDHPFL